MRLQPTDIGRVVVFRQSDGSLVRGIIIRISMPCRFAVVSLILNNSKETIVVQAPFKKIVSVGDKMG